MLEQLVVLALAADAARLVWFHNRGDGNGLFQPLRERLADWEHGADTASSGAVLRYYIAAGLRCQFCVTFYSVAIAAIVWQLPVGPQLLVAAAAARISLILQLYIWRTADPSITVDGYGI